MEARTCVYIGEDLARYGFGQGHPFGPDRMDAFWETARAAGLDRRVEVCRPVAAPRTSIERFHTRAYVDRVMAQSQSGAGFLDLGDTPAFPGVYEAAACVAGSVLDAVERLVSGACRRAFVPIAGLHHARRDSAAGFCVFNDCGIAIETLFDHYGMSRVAYVDIDAHHGDGVFYSFADDPRLVFADMHEDGRYLYPGTGTAEETGTGAAAGTKLNIPMPPQAADELFLREWDRLETFVAEREPEFFLLQCGADSIAGDPITHLQYSPAAHRHAAQRLCRLADRQAQGRLLAMGGGGYNRHNLAQAWMAVLAALIET
ncbi:MAG: acetoin utilization protein AcuC [Gammaproteobacteria bacterium]|jgi:acetoin utilization protein AcuC